MLRAQRASERSEEEDGDGQVLHGQLIFIHRAAAAFMNLGQCVREFVYCHAHTHAHTHSRPCMSGFVTIQRNLSLLLALLLFSSRWVERVAFKCCSKVWVKTRLPLTRPKRIQNIINMLMCYCQNHQIVFTDLRVTCVCVCMCVCLQWCVLDIMTHGKHVMNHLGKHWFTNLWNIGTKEWRNWNVPHVCRVTIKYRLSITVSQKTHVWRG